jgi:hypothetical protein
MIEVIHNDDRFKYITFYPAIAWGNDFGKHKGARVYSDSSIKMFNYTHRSDRLTQFVGKTKKDGNVDLDEKFVLREFFRYFSQTRGSKMTQSTLVNPISKNLQLVQFIEDGKEQKAGIFHTEDGSLIAYFADNQILAINDDDETIEITVTKAYTKSIVDIIKRGEIKDGDEDFIKKIINIIGVKVKLMDA